MSLIVLILTICFENVDDRSKIVYYEIFKMNDSVGMSIRDVLHSKIN